MSFEDHALGLPPNTQSSSRVDCDLAAEWDVLRDQARSPRRHPTSSIYYALAHYHALGTGLDDRRAAARRRDHDRTMFETTHAIGDSLGGTIDPPFDDDRLHAPASSRATTTTTRERVDWGIGNQEMCVFLAFTDSPYNWGGGATRRRPAGRSDRWSTACMTFTHAVHGVRGRPATH